jgi:hypothetical protein
MPTKNKDFSPNESSLFTKMQKMLQFFLEILQVAGGDLNISKCACFTVFHRWSGGHASLLKIKDSHPIMTITHLHTGEIKTIDKKDPNQGHRDLGWMLTTEKKSITQFKVLKHKAKLFAGAILQSRMQHYDATTAYKLYYLVSAATRLSLNQLKTIQSPVVCATLNKMSINHNVARAIIFSPKRL